LAKYLKKRGNIYHFQKRIPKAYRSNFDQGFIQVSLGTDSSVLAQRRANSFNLILSDFLKTLDVEDSNNQNQIRLDELVKEAQNYGFEYMPIKKLVSEAPLVDFVNRLKIASKSPEQFTKEAILGTIDETPASIKVSKALVEYFEYESGNQFEMSENQLRKWKNPRKKAFRNFIKVVGDKPISGISRQDILDFRAWWIDRIESENLATNSANKEFGFVRRILKIAIDNHEIGRSSEELFKGISLKKIEKTRRYPFKTDFVENILFKPHQVHEEVQLLIYAMADTGARISELVGLEDKDIVLDHAIPHIRIRPNETRILKTEQSERDIPLVGASLLAFKTLDGSFKHYFNKPDLISTVGNKYFRENEIFPSKHHSLYSLRHSFEDRLTAVEPPDKVQAALMGHKYIRPRYGAGPSLEQKRVWLDKIAFKTTR